MAMKKNFAQGVRQEEYITVCYRVIYRIRYRAG